MDPEINAKNLPPVFMLDLMSHGYSITRALSKYNIKVVGFIPIEGCLVSFSRIPIKKHLLPKTDEGKLNTLTEAAREFPGVKPVLFVNFEEYFPFIHKYHNELSVLFSFEFPIYDELKLLLEKDLFNTFARNHNIKIPLSIEVTNNNLATLELLNSLQFPLVIKPKHRDDSWLNTFDSQKVILAETPEEAYATCRKLFNTIDRLVIQEWIPGPDSNIFFCLTYITKNGDILDSVCGQKIHQYPVLFGNTSSAIIIENSFLEKETHRILKEAETYGFCSVEFKQHDITGEYYVIEPTVGRMDRQEYIATIGNKNIVLKAYCHLAGIEQIKTKETKNKYLYIEETLEINSLLDFQQYKILKWRAYIKLLLSRKIRLMHLSYKDPAVSVRVIYAITKSIFKYMTNSSASKKKKDNGIKELIKSNQNLTRHPDTYLHYRMEQKKIKE